MEILLKIHDFFADGGSPDKLTPGTPAFDVYSAEREATGKLLNFYKTFVDGDFEEIVFSVKSFAKADAARFRLRDKMRAKEIVDCAAKFSSVYVEAGEIHLGILRELRSRKPPDTRIKSTFLMSPVYEKISGYHRIFGPGDILTLHLIFQTGAEDAKLSLLAARSLVYNKLLEKEEMIDAETSYPHTRNEIETIKKVNALTYKDCETIFSKIRYSSTAGAITIFEDLLKGGKG
jgi:hypothetical protein